MRFRNIAAAVLGSALLAVPTFAQTQDPAAAPRLEAATTSAAAAAASGVTGSDGHQVGAGVRLGGYGFGAGLSGRAFFMGPIGIQAELLHYGFVGYGIMEVQGSVLYRLKDMKFNAPLILTPYVGGGIAFAHASYDFNYSYLGTVYSASSNDTGAVIQGGAEVFIEKLPKVGISAQVSFDTIDNGVIGGYGGAGVTIAAHWYFH